MDSLLVDYVPTYRGARSLVFLLLLGQIFKRARVNPHIFAFNHLQAMDAFSLFVRIGG